jgi:hypothetical protein
MAWLNRFLLVCVLFGCASTGFAVRVQGIVRDASTRLPVRGALVTMERAGALVVKVVTRVDGYYRFEVRSGERAVIRFDHADRVPRHVVFDATDVPREWNDALEANMDMRLFRELAGADSLMLHAPAGICKWDPDQENMAWDLERSALLTERWNALLETHLQEHPDQRPTDLQRWWLVLFDFSVEWSLYLSFALIWLIYVLTQQVLQRSGRTARIVLLVGQLSLAVWLVFDLGTDVGPLRFVAFLGLLVGLMALGLLISEFLFGGGLSQEWNEAVEEYTEVEEYDDADEQFITEDPVDEKSRRWRGWATMALFFLALFAFIFEGRNGLENTLEVLGLVGKSALVGLVLAAVVAWFRTPVVVRKFLRLMLWSGGVWWLVLPLLCMAGASFLNRTFLQGEVACATWPVAEVTHGRRGTKVRVAWNGERERLEMPKAIKEQLTTLDSLHCCTRTGLLGHDVVFQVEAVIDTGDRP